MSFIKITGTLENTNLPKVLLRFAIKLVLLFLVLNFLFGLLPIEVGKISVYGSLVEARERFPFGEAPQQAYNFSLFNIEAMFRSHELEEISGRDEYSVVILGDSSVWGTLLKNDETLSGQLNQQGLVSMENGLPVHFYNAGYPTISVTKDLLLLNEINKRYQPDAVIWLVTLESLPHEKQLVSPLVKNNLESLLELSQDYDLGYSIPENQSLQSIWQGSAVGQRRDIADVMRLQFFGFLWDATGIDQYYPETYHPAQRDLEASREYYKFNEASFSKENLALDIFSTGKSILGEDTPLLIVNEPILISQGENSDIRYNFYYPRWVYDGYREIMNEFAVGSDLNYADFWNIIPENEFTNSAIHLSPVGESILAEAIQDYLILSELIQK